jgi:hypothetical protein
LQLVVDIVSVGGGPSGTGAVSISGHFEIDGLIKFPE